MEPNNICENCGAVGLEEQGGSLLCSYCGTKYDLPKDDVVDADPTNITINIMDSSFEDIINGSFDASSLVPQKPKWYDTKWAIVLFLFLFWPVALVLAARNKSLGRTVKWLVAGICLLLLLVGLARIASH